MFFSTRLIGAAALLSGFAAALPRPDSATGNEVAVSAPNGTPISAINTTSATGSTVVSATEVSGNSGNVGSGWASQTWTTQAWNTATSTPSYSSGSSWSSSSYGSGSSWSSATSSASDSSWSSYPSSGSGSSNSVPSYGSGSSSWGNQNYNSCVQQCVASFGNPSATYTPPTATSVSGSGSSGSSTSGATHTVIVAPTQGLLRFVPFALNASVGDTIQFNWGANNHTVTKSSSLTPCNKTSDNPFSSGEQNKGFVFTQVVNDTNPTFFYCGTPTHCEKGMFGIINPPNALGSPTSASGMMPSLAANDSTFGAYANYTNSMTAGNAAAAGWGGSIDMSSLPTWALPYAAENILYTRTFLAANSEVLQNDGFMNLTSSGSTPLIYPQDFTSSVAVNSTGATSTATLPSVTSSVSSSVSASSGPYPSASSLGSSSSASAAISTSSSKILLGLVVGFATFMIF